MNYNSHAWRAMSNTVRLQEPYCRFCDDYTATVDHIDGNTDNNKRENLQALCLQCHNMKTAAYEKKQQPLAGLGIAHLKNLVFRKLKEPTFWEQRYSPDTFNPPIAVIKIVNIDGMRLEFVTRDTFCNLQLKSYASSMIWGLQVASYVFTALVRNERDAAKEMVQRQWNTPGMMGTRKALVYELKNLAGVDPVNVLDGTREQTDTNGERGINLLCDMFASISKTYFNNNAALFQYADIQHTLLYEYAYRHFLAQSTKV